MLFKKRLIPAGLTTLSLPYSDSLQKTVRVYVPEHKKGQKLPVIYMTDGQSVFDEESNPLGCWHTREAVAAEQAASGKAAIIVGIHSEPHPMHRTAELTPASMGAFTPPPMDDLPPMPPMPEGMPPMPEGMPPMPGGMPPMPEGMPPMPENMTPEMLRKMMEDMMKNFKPDGEKFDEFVVSTVMPAVEKQFPVKKGRDNTAIIGSSSGGLEVFYTALTHPSLFCAVGALSPAFLFYKPEDVVKWTSERLGKTIPFLYLYCGEGEPKEKQMCDAARPVFELIESRVPEKNCRIVITPDAIHNESAWEPVFKDFLHLFLHR